MSGLALEVGEKHEQLQRRRRRGVRWTVAVLLLIVLGFYLSVILGLRG